MKKTTINDVDLAEFYAAVKGTTPLKAPAKILRPHKIKQRTAVSSRESTLENIFLVSEQRDLQPLHSNEYISYAIPGIGQKILRKLHKAQYNVDARLDLHGLTVTKARLAVAAFIEECIKHHCHVALIIHGKGKWGEKPILKNKLNHWLREVKQVIAFCSADSTFGGGGALCVLLKRQNKGE